MSDFKFKNIVEANAEIHRLETVLGVHVAGEKAKFFNILQANTHIAMLEKIIARQTQHKTLAALPPGSLVELQGASARAVTVAAAASILKPSALFGRARFNAQVQKDLKALSVASSIILRRGDDGGGAAVQSNGGTSLTRLQMEQIANQVGEVVPNGLSDKELFARLEVAAFENHLRFPSMGADSKFPGPRNALTGRARATKEFKQQMIDKITR